MSLSIYQVSVPVLVRGLGILSELLRKGEAHATTAGIEPAALLTARLAPDMFPFAGQVQRASDTAKFAASRLTGTEAPAFPDEEVTFPELQGRIGRTVAFLRTFDEAQFADAETREIPVGSGVSARRLVGTSYILEFALPNFFFHVTTAYDILRHNGVAVGKRDYLWPAA